MTHADALVLTKPRLLERRTFDLPEITETTGRLRVEACGLCGTDHEMWSGAIRKGLPLIPGHEAIGIIERIGPMLALLPDRIAGGN